MLFRFFNVVALAVTLVGSSASAYAADLLDPTPLTEQQEFRSVDSLNFELSGLGGGLDRNVLGSASNFMFIGSVASPIPFFENFGIQADAGAGVYDSDFTSAAAGLHIFLRDTSRGFVGIYGDWSYVNPEHAGRVGGEFAFYNDRWSLDVLAGIQFGQHVVTHFVDEVDLSYYFTDNFRASIGHRYISRGNVGNVSFEHLLNDVGFEGWSTFGEFEVGEDDFVYGFAGLRYAFGSSASTLIERDRKASVKVRIPRNLASVSQCGDLDVPRAKTSLRAEMSNICADEDKINSLSTVGITKAD